MIVDPIRDGFDDRGNAVRASKEFRSPGRGGRWQAGRVIKIAQGPHREPGISQRGGLVAGDRNEIGGFIRRLS